MESLTRFEPRPAPLDLPPDEFRQLGYQLVGRIAAFLASLPERPATPGETRQTLRAALGGSAVPMHGPAPGSLLEEAATLLFDHSLFDGQPRFWGYVTSSAASIGAPGDLLAAAVNPNVGAHTLSPIATALEAQTVRWMVVLQENRRVRLCA